MCDRADQTETFKMTVTTAAASATNNELLYVKNRSRAGWYRRRRPATARR